MPLGASVQPWPGLDRLRLVEVEASWKRPGGGRGKFQLQGGWKLSGGDVLIMAVSAR